MRSKPPTRPSPRLPVPARAVPKPLASNRAVMVAAGKSNGKPHGKIDVKVNGKTNGKEIAKANGKPNAKPEPKILYQKFFKSVGYRTYAAQIKELINGNHLLVLTEGKRDEQTGDVRKTKLFVYGEDFSAFFRLLHETAAFIRANPLSEEVRERRDRFWAKKARQNRDNASSSAE